MARCRSLDPRAETRAPQEGRRAALADRRGSLDGDLDAIGWRAGLPYPEPGCRHGGTRDDALAWCVAAVMTHRIVTRPFARVAHLPGKAWAGAGEGQGGADPLGAASQATPDGGGRLVVPVRWAGAGVGHAGAALTSICIRLHGSPRTAGSLTG